MKVIVIIEKGEDSTYDANLSYYENIDFGLFGQGGTVKETIEDFYKSYEEMRQLYKDQKKQFTELDFDFKYDMASFLAYYGNVMTLAGLSRLTGVNKGQLSHYVTGYRKPGKKTTEKIEKSLHQFAEELHRVQFI